MKKIPTLSLFSGAGGLDLGFLQAGFDIVACVEIEAAYCETLRANVGGPHGFGSGAIVHHQDITTFDASPYRNMGIKCVVGGPPCQTFSAAGRRAGGVIGTEDKRGQLFMAYCRVLDQLQPDVFVFENVYGLPGANGGGPWREICSAFESRGYALTAEVVDAADYGVPQHRERLILVGSRIGPFRFPMPTHGPDAETGEPLISVEAALADLQDPQEEFRDDLGGLYGHLLPLVPEGLNYSYFTAEMGHPEPVFAWRSKFHDLLYKVDRTAPCRTLKAQPGKFTGPFHWKNRHFSIPELKRLQTFPDDYEVKGGFGKVLEQIGNSVPPRLAFVMASAVREQLLAREDNLTFPVRPVGFASTFRQRQRARNARFHEVAKAAIAKQYGAGASEAEPQPLRPAQFHLTARSLFDRSKSSSPPKSTNHPTFQVSVEDVGRHVEITFRDRAIAHAQVSVVEISGLRKYLPGYDTLSLTAEVARLEDVFHAWTVIEEALTERSRFFTLIDIYGHYANRGDTVDVEASWNLPIRADLLRTLNFFSKTKHCGDFNQTNELKSELGLNDEGFRQIVANLRAARFDVRTSATHPIIREGRTICTYPFPLLSPRALVESRAEFLQLAVGDGLNLAEAS